MVKKIFILATIALAMFMVSCNSCSKPKDLEPENTEFACIDVTETQLNDFSYMGMHYENYEWMESCIDMVDFIDEADTFNVSGVANVFKVIYVDSITGGFRPIVVLIAHTADTTAYEVKEGLWVGDNDMREFVPLDVDFPTAWNRMMETNCVKPHSRHCVLRKEVGPKNCNPQYIFGNKTRQVYVDCITGDVTDKNPVFDGYENDDFVLDCNDDTVNVIFRSDVFEED